MKLIFKSATLFFSLLLLSCGGKEEKKKEGFSVDRVKTPTEKPVEAPVTNTSPASQRINLTDKGIGPVKSVTLAPEIDQALAKKGEGIYEQMCMACHKPDKKFIGPAPKGIFERRTPEWVMNMILNPEVMIKEDPLAKDLLQEFNGAPMANQHLTEEQARAVLEYFRTL